MSGLRKAKNFLPQESTKRQLNLPEVRMYLCFMMNVWARQNVAYAKMCVKKALFLLTVRRIWFLSITRSA